MALRFIVKDPDSVIRFPKRLVHFFAEGSG